MVNALSYSRISNYLKCPLAYKYYVQRVPIEKGPPLIVGSISHSVFETYFKHCLELGVASDVTAIGGIAEKAFWASKDSPHPDLLDDVMEIATKFADSHVVHAVKKPHIGKVVGVCRMEVQRIKVND